MKKGVAAPAPETNLKWLERTREGAHVFCDSFFIVAGHFTSTNSLGRLALRDRLPLQSRRNHPSLSISIIFGR